MLPELVPINTTKTAAYEAAATSVFVLDIRTPKDSTSKKTMTATETLSGFLVCEGLRAMAATTGDFGF